MRGIADPTVTFDRHYGAPAAGRFALRVYLLCCAFAGVLIMLNNHGGIPTALIAAVYYALLLLILVWAERSFPHLGMYESPESLRLVRLRLGYSQTELLWELIDRFEQSKRLPRGRVLVVGTNGRVVPVVGTAQGSRIVWDGGETRDIVGVLNERLSIWRAQRGRAEP